MLRRLPLRQQSQLFDALVIGGGPGGYVSAIRLAQLGLSTACIEKHSNLGGTCLNVGCIPSKSLLQGSWRYYDSKHHSKQWGITYGDAGEDKVTIDIPALMSFKNRTVSGLNRGIESLFRKNKVTRIQGHASFLNAKTVAVTDASNTTTVQAANIVIATGSSPVTLPCYDGTTVVTSDEAVNFTSVPKELVVVGGGIIGLELGSVWARLGSKVTVVESRPHLSVGPDAEAAKSLHHALTQQGLNFHFGARLREVRKLQDGGVAILTDGKELPYEKLLLAIGRRPNTAGLRLEKIGVTVEAGGQIPVDLATMQVRGCENIYAVGDVVAGPMLAHKAEDEGVWVAERLAANGVARRPSAGSEGWLEVPSVVYTHPEVAWVGTIPEEASEMASFRFPFMANSRARAVAETEGFVKLFVRETKVVGAVVVHAQAGELLHALAVAIKGGVSVETLAHMSVAHPTLSEALKEAAMAADWKCVHF